MLYTSFVLPKKILPIILIIFSLALAFGLFSPYKEGLRSPGGKVDRSSPTPLPTPTPTPSPSPSPTPKPLTAAERESLYGPCANLPVLMFHHINTEEAAKADNYVSLNVLPANFAADLKYLNDHGYHTVAPADLINFFRDRTPLPAKPVMLTFDDGYQDFYTQAVPLLSQYSAKATLFVPTGLINNSPYLSWDEVSAVSRSADVYFANHTWSHHSAYGDLKTQTYEITTADTQLAERGFNPDKVFAYPYGTPSATDQQVLSSLGYQLAFTTTPGRWQCAKQKYILPRIRIGNASLSSYGL